MADGHPGSDESQAGDYWREILTGEDRGLNSMQRFLRRVPRAPRCKLCQAPFDGPYAPALRLLGFRRWTLNQQICRWCIKDLETHQGGAEIPVSVLFADVRGSTSIAESMSAGAFTSVMNDFYSIVARSIDGELGVIDHIAGDGVMAMWIPGFVGARHPDHAVAAGRRMVAELAANGTVEVGVAVHTGEAYVGVVGDPGARDFTILWDVANTVARLSSAAARGELAMSDAVAVAAGVSTADMDHRVLELKGKAEPVHTWIEHLDGGRFE